MVFPHFLFIVCSVLILNTNCYACSNTLSVAKKFSGCDKYMCVVVLCVGFAEARLAPSHKKKDRQIGTDSQVTERRMICS